MIQIAVLETHALPNSTGVKKKCVHMNVYIAQPFLKIINASFAIHTRKQKKRLKMKSTCQKQCVQCNRTNTPKWRGLRKGKPLCNSCFFKHRRFRKAEVELNSVIQQMLKSKSIDKAKICLLNSNVLLASSRIRKTYHPSVKSP